MRKGGIKQKFNKEEKRNSIHFFCTHSMKVFCCFLLFHFCSCFSGIPIIILCFLFSTSSVLSGNWYPSITCESSR